MLFRSKIIRKQPVDLVALAAITGSEKSAESLLKPDYCGRIGFAPFELTNNNAKIKATRERIVELEKRKATTPQELTINGVRVLENTEAMRLQLFFNGKPAPDVIALLKSHAFKWSPSNMAWQRQLTSNAIYSFKTWIKPALKGVAA